MSELNMMEYKSMVNNTSSPVNLSNKIKTFPKVLVKMHFIIDLNYMI